MIWILRHGEMTTEELEDRYDKLLFGVQRSVRYHRRRERFLDRFADWGKVITALAGSATFASIAAELDDPWPRYFAAGLTALLAASDVIFNPSRLARQHNDLARDFIRLERDMVCAQAEAELTAPVVATFQARRLSIEAKEPPHYRVLNMMCHNELVRALGRDPAQCADIGLLRRIVANVIDLPGRIDKRSRVALPPSATGAAARRLIP